ncbi:hypothetical protein L198_08204 [Cryptococcus wingfieldii CBS 7118]|uniref:Uncharacterized protein n=1 Tax=Cryptococcus wingfieldii CBS 7118 TaxID=1295528 RepID=A0A1E3HF16_9TREE|nr:hypothetical protein L198_08187 [Cryptococcus wingfieldii CBS 7118]XP_019027862.1 hypothetical protein L198_08204 [Cryptococcus wingfieldii CBS 7118]ODN74936.1 hypothetical protein L198_08187 [Cryptococcus wingfieldii CBS 7118]ODN74953.1 hypothetical protein L198_08204 [Cryptococcus wingfieldii CBS 7118]
MPQVTPSSKASIFPRTAFTVSTAPTEVTAKSVGHTLYSPSVSFSADDASRSRMREKAELLGTEVLNSVDTFLSSNLINKEHYTRPTEKESCQAMEDLVRTYAKKAETEKVGTVDWSIISLDLPESRITRVQGSGATDGPERG